MRIRRTFLIVWIITCALLAAFLGGYLTHRELNRANSEFSLLAQAFDILSQHGYADLPAEPTLQYGMIRGMLQAYGDPYTSFLEPARHELQTNDLTGEFGGIGVRLERNAAGEYLVFPFANSPALTAGLQDNDRLVRIESLEVTPDTLLDDVQAAIRGPVGEPVRIEFVRSPGTEVQEVSVVRTAIAIPSVAWNLDPDEPRLGMIIVNLIAASTPGEIQNAIKDLQSQGATHFVLDLRNNHGGLLNAGVDAARLFLQDGVVIEQQYRGRGVEAFKVESPGEFTDLPLAVLVNNGTASAAEILAGALQAHGRAILIGQPTFGKDTLQLVFELQDKSSLHVTAARWWVPGPDGIPLDAVLLPDIPVETAELPARPEVQAAIQHFFSR